MPEIAHPGPPPNDSTMLVISVMGVPKYSARGLTQSLEPIAASKTLRRSVNGLLLDLTHEQFKKYSSVISCTDVDTPSLDGIFPGLTVTVDCVCELAYPTGGSPHRDAVPGSTRTANGFNYYRPRLTMMVTSTSQEFDEWGATVPWQLELEEV